MNKITTCDHEHVIWARGPNCWGRAKSRKEAIKLARQAGTCPPGFRKWVITLLPVDSEIDLMDGTLTWDKHECHIIQCLDRQRRPKPEPFLPEIFGPCDICGGSSAADTCKH